VDDPNAFARTAFIEALERQGVSVAAPAVSGNPTAVLPDSFGYPDATTVASLLSTPYSQHARLILKVSLNLGANVSLSLFGLEKGARTRDGALAAERQTLIQDFGVPGEGFLFPTNGSGSPDSQASPLAIVSLLRAMAATPVGQTYQQCLPIMGIDGSLANTGTTLPGRGHVFAKTGTTIGPGADGDLQLKAQNLAGSIETRSGRKVAYALMVNDAGPVDLEHIDRDVGEVFEDEGLISSLIYESL
jgi:D-alanyl-D-alanine carboxypeptidase/D-alanyl-D-alanine-endopeptidase (penicillin-binding protein 4)